MHFSEQQKAIFKANLRAIKGSQLDKEFAKIKKPKDFKLHFGADALDINIEDVKNRAFVYENPLQELSNQISLYQQKYPLYPLLYFYGFGNGVLLKALLQNEQLKHLIVFEPNVELLWLIFHVIDFSVELKNQRLLVFVDDISAVFLELLYGIDRTHMHYMKIYFLEIQSDYYAKDQEKILALNKKITDYLMNFALQHGNSPIDALEGIQNRTQNLVRQLTHPSVKELIKKRSMDGKTAVIVGTGPSLTKQLPLLKKYQEKAHIFCADSAFPILMRNDIVPDYCFMLERTDFTAEFFNHDFKGRDKNTLFIIMDVVHPNALAYLEKFNRRYIIAPKSATFSIYLNFRDFALYSALNVSDCAIWTTLLLNYKNIIFIGQDLAYASNGASHPQDYQHSAFYESEEKKFETEAYGGKGVVQTNEYWRYFLAFIEKNLEIFKQKCDYYNCTEGGARIKNTTEMPFKEACEKFIDKQDKKHFEKLENDNEMKQNQNLLKAYAKIKKSIVLSENLMEKFSENLNTLKNIFENGISLKSSFEANKIFFEECDKIINAVKSDMDDNKMHLESTDPLLRNFDMMMASLYVYNPQNEVEKNEKMYLWVLKHIEFIRDFSAQISAQKGVMEANLSPLKDELTRRGDIIKAKMEMIDKKDRGAMMFANLS